MQQRHTVIAVVERARAQAHRRIEQAKGRPDKMDSQPIAANDGDDASRVDHARERDRAEHELALAEEAASALRSLASQLEEVLAPDAEEQQRARDRSRELLDSRG